MSEEKTYEPLDTGEFVSVDNTKNLTNELADLG